ncbi:prokineticin-1 [Lagopus leucura]|uniref:prokineticin-1 n=1 Tax=Lagopus leucura TaxID=30410 RepID=UPI001C66FC4F|nr:prokineticin-1 [Lagopus leucura]XP_042740015.1 prokineticin-1 [Lagopus leucura]
MTINTEPRQDFCCKPSSSLLLQARSPSPSPSGAMAEQNSCLEETEPPAGIRPSLRVRLLALMDGSQSCWPSPALWPQEEEACERDPQCGSGTCCAVSLWLRGLRMCTPLGQEGDECHPFSHKVPFLGKRQHHTCPCLPNFSCSRFLDGRYRCSLDFKNFDF